MGETNPIMLIKGVNGQIALFEHKIVIYRKGFLAKGQGIGKGDKEILISSINAIQMRQAGAITSGYIQFVFQGSHETKGGLMDAMKDENTVAFTRQQAKEFNTLKDEVERRMVAAKAAPNQAVSPAEELGKFAALRDQGIITASEFEAKKKQILGL